MSVNLATDVAEALTEGRALIESLMTDTCTVTRVDPDAEQGEMDPDTMQYPDAEPLTVYAGKCRVQIKSVIASSSDADAGDRRGVVQEFELQLPIDGTDDIAVNDVVRMDSAAHDASLVGREFTVAARHEKSQATARRLRVQEVTG